MSASWVIVEIATGRAVLETYSEQVKDAINLEKYRAVEVLEYLQDLNKSIKENQA
jgi:hypothetical protein